MLAYCDYIAHIIKESLEANKNGEIPFEQVGRVKMDLNELGHFMSTKKTIRLLDGNGKSYQISITEED